MVTLITYPDGSNQPGVEIRCYNGFVARVVGEIENVPDALRTAEILNAHFVAQESNSHDANGRGAGQQAHKDGGPFTGADNSKCLEIRGGGVSETDAAPTPRVVLTYERARVIDAYEHLEIRVDMLPPPPSGLRGELRRDGWHATGLGTWERKNTAAAIASARGILRQFYGEPVDA